MNSTMVRALVVLIPVSGLLCYSLFAFRRSSLTASVLRLIGASGFVMVVLAHLCEAMNVFPWMGWGLAHSVGHYLDLTSAFVGFAFFSAGILVNRFSKRQTEAALAEPDDRSKCTG